MQTFFVRVLLIFTYCFFLFPTKATAQDSPFKVGIMFCLTGECAEWGANSLKGIKLAAEEINTAGGIRGRRLEIVVEDTAE